MTAIKQQQPDKVDEHFITVKFINPTQTIKNETLQTIAEIYKDKFATSVADVVVEPTIKECKRCTTKLKNT